LQKLWTNKILRKISRKLINGTAYPFSIRETSPKEVWTRSTNSIFNCISYNSSDEHRKQKAWIFINPSGVGNQNSNIETTDARFSKRKNSERTRDTQNGMVHIVDIPSYEIIHENDSHGQQYCNNLL
jgi:PhoPQ-activated pathogenicity-related protein